MITTGIVSKATTTFISFVFALFFIFPIFEHHSYAGYYSKILNASFVYISLLCTEVDLQAR